MGTGMLAAYVLLCNCIMLAFAHHNHDAHDASVSQSLKSAVVAAEGDSTVYHDQRF